MAAPRTYDAKKYIITVGGQSMSGYADGVFVTAARNNDSWNIQSGADGAVTRSKTNDATGTITINLQQTSNSNDILSAAAFLDEISNQGVVPIVVKDLSGTTLVESSFSWLKKPPDVEAAKEVSERSWVFDCADLKMYVGGNPTFGGIPESIGSLF